MEIEIRQARKDDQGPLAELMYSSGQDIYAYLYNKKAIDFLNYEFASGRGFAGYPNVTVAVFEGKVVGTGCFYDRAQFQRLVPESIRNMKGFFGMLKIMPVMIRARHVSSIMVAPRHGELYLSNFGVSPEYQGKGIGSQILQYKLNEAKTQGYKLMGLDVSVANPRGQALYERTGFVVQQEKYFSKKNADVNPARKMEFIF